MRHGATEVVHVTAEAVADVNSVRLPTQPVKVGVTAAAVSAERQSAAFGLGVVRIIDAYKRSTET